MTAPAVKLDTARGRLVVTGPDALRLRHLPGAAFNEHRGWIELSLTIETLRAVRKALDLSQSDLVQRCSVMLLAWARAAGRSEKILNALHEQMATGWRQSFHWYDATGHPATGEYRWPFEHQTIMASVAAEVDGCAFLCQMGTAKTRPAVVAMESKVERGYVDVHVVVCPKGVIPTWQRQISEWGKPGVLHPVMLTGSLQSRRERIADERGRGTVLIVNYEALATLEGALTLLARRAKVGLILDEAHRVKNPNALVTRAAMKLAQNAEWRLTLTGTPILQGIQDIWSQWYVIDLGVTFGANFVQYRREFLLEDFYTRRLLPAPHALEEVGLRLRRRGLRYTKAECLDLPPKVYETITVEMTAAQEKAYDEMEEELITQLEEEDAKGTAVASTQMTKGIRLSQITSGYLPDADTKAKMRFTPNPKLDALEELVRDNIDDQKIIVWACWVEDIRAITERLKNLKPVVIQGGQSVAERAEAENAFQRGDVRLLVANPATGGVGLDLFAASLVIYYSQRYSLEHREQSEDRSHRAGSEIHERVTYIDLIVPNTIDEVVQAALLAKKSVAEAVVDLKQSIKRKRGER